MSTENESAVGVKIKYVLIYEGRKILVTVSNMSSPFSQSFAFSCQQLYRQMEHVTTVLYYHSYADSKFELIASNELGKSELKRKQSVYVRFKNTINR